MLRDARVPFSPNDVADIGTFLLLSTSLSAALHENRRRAPVAAIAAALFAAANIALWIAWSGEWLRDIVGGLPFGYFLCVCACALSRTGALRREERLILTAAGVAVVALETARILLAGRLPQVKAYELIAYCLLFAFAGFFLVRIAFALRGGEDADRTLSLAYGGFCWLCVAMYMSADVWYDLASVLLSVFHLLLFLSVRKKVLAE